MPTSLNPICAVQEPQREKKSPSKKFLTGMKLFQAAALAAFLIPFGSGAAEATSITCDFGTESQTDSLNCVGGDGGTLATFFFQDFGSPYSITFDFAEVFSPFSITLEDTVIPKSVLDGSETLPSGTGCLPIADGVSNCVVFNVTSVPEPGPTTWDGFYNVYIAWDTITEPTYPGSTVGLAHAPGTDPNFVDITIEGSYNAFDPGPPPCSFTFPYCGGVDASIGGTDDNFSGFTATTTATPVPEPASVLLVTTGLGGLIYRKLRERRSGAAPRL